MLIREIVQMFGRSFSRAAEAGTLGMDRTQRGIWSIPRWFLISGLLLAIGLTTTACARREGRGLAGETPLAPAGSADYTPGDYVEELQVSGQARRYRLHVPLGYDPARATALVVNLHGLNSNAAQQEHVSQMSVKADQVGFIVVYPEGLGDPQSWRVGPRAEGAADLQFMRDLVGRLQERLNVDPRRIYATGISNGAQMTHRLGCEMADVFAAIAPVSGGYPPLDTCRPSRPVPVVAFHGTEDSILPYEGKGRILIPIREWAADWAERNGCDPAPAVTFQQGEVTGETWGDCQEGAVVVLYTIEGRGHSWPGSDMPADITTQDIDATGVIWDFFAAHPMP